MDRQPEASDEATVGMVDTANNDAWVPLARTRAWNWQQGCMLQWLGASEEIIFNDRRGGAFISRVLNTRTGRERVLERPVYGVSRDGRKAVTLNFARLHHQRPGYGYAGIADPWEDVAEPEEDGIYGMDLETGASRLIISIAQIAGFERQINFAGCVHRFNHLQFSPDGRRFAFLHRYRNEAERGGHTRFFTATPDGGVLHCLSSEMVSHYDWKGNDTLIAWAERHPQGCHYFLFRDQSEEVETVGEGLFNRDGHCSVSPDGRWMLTDSYPDANGQRPLLLFDWKYRLRYDIGRFDSLPLESPLRCDLHPRWSRDGGRVCIDSTHEGERQMYALDLHRFFQLTLNQKKIYSTRLHQ